MSGKGQGSATPPPAASTRKANRKFPLVTPPTADTRKPTGSFLRHAPPAVHTPPTQRANRKFPLATPTPTAAIGTANTVSRVTPLPAFPHRRQTKYPAGHGPPRACTRKENSKFPPPQPLPLATPLPRVWTTNRKYPAGHAPPASLLCQSLFLSPQSLVCPLRVLGS